MAQPLLVLLFAAVAITVGVFAWRAEQKRLRLLYHWARTRGLTRVEGRSRGWDQRFGGLKLLDRGRSRQAKLVLQGVIDGRPVTCLDWQFVTGSGKNRQTHRYAVVIVETGWPTIPLEIRREHLLDRVGEFLGHDDIDFESAEFSRTFYVTSADRKWAYDVIHTRTMEYLLQAPPFTISFGFGEIAVVRTGRLEPHSCEDALKVARTMLDLIPDYVIEDLKGGKA